MTRWLRLFPREWRERYGTEVESLLSTGARSRRRDVTDLFLAAVAVWADHLVEALHRRRSVMRLVRAGAAALSIIGVLSVAWAVTELQDGIAELPRHWWSTLAAAPLIAGVIISAVAWWPRRGPATG